MDYTIKAKEIFMEMGVIKDSHLTVSDGVIGEIGSVELGEVIDVSGCLLLPGLLDIHVHGGDSADTMDLTADAIRRIARFKALQGVTAFCPTTVTGPLNKQQAAVELVRDMMKNGGSDTAGAKLIGSFLEGPYIDPRYKGAHPAEYIRDIAQDELAALIDLGGGTITSVAIAPDKPGTAEAIQYLKSRGVNVRIGHSGATCDECRAAVGAGASIAIHTFNAMSPFNHREPGMVGEILVNNDIYSELICDLVHVHPTAMKALIRAKGVGRIILITDCMSAGGLDDGSYMLGELPVTVKDSIARTADGALAGSTLDLMTAIKNMHEAVGVSLFDAVAMASIIPARALGLDGELGSIMPGKRADLVAIDSDYNIRLVMIDGRIVKGLD